MLLSGLVGGWLAGLLGIGGGIVFVVVLPVALGRMGIPAGEMAGFTIANSLFATFFSAVGAIYAHSRRQAVPWRTIHWVGVPAAAAALAVQLTVVHQPWYTQARFQGVVVALLLTLLARSAWSLIRPERTLPEGRMPPARPARLAGLGLGAGVVSALSGLGGGVFVVPVLRYLYAYPAPAASLVSNGAIAWASVASLAAALALHPATAHVPGQTGYLLWPLALPLAAGVMLAAPYGVALAHRSSPRRLTWVYMIFVSLVVVRLLGS